MAKNTNSQITPVEFGAGPLRGKLYGMPSAPAHSPRALVLISHGAGGSMDSAFMVDAAQALAKEGFLILTWNFAYVDAHRMPSAGGKREQPEMAEAIEFLKEIGGASSVILIGKSFGGRVGSYLGATRQDIAAYVFFGIPLRGIGKNPKPRDWGHLSKLQGRALFVTGDKDKLCPLEELDVAHKHLKIPFESVIVSGDHSFKPRGEEAALAACLRWMKSNY